MIVAGDWACFGADGDTGRFGATTSTSDDIVSDMPEEGNAHL